MTKQGNVTAPWSQSFCWLGVTLQPPEARLDQMTGVTVSSRNATESRSHSAPSSPTTHIQPQLWLPLSPKLPSLSSHEKDRDYKFSKGFKWQSQDSSGSIHFAVQNDDMAALLGSLGQLVFYLAPTLAPAPFGEGRHSQLLNTYTGAEAKDPRRICPLQYHWRELIECLLCAWHDTPRKTSEPLGHQQRAWDSANVPWPRAF